MKTSVFTKLTVVMLITGIVINAMLIVLAVTGFRHRHRLFFRQNLVQYLSYMVDDISVPPDRMRAEKIAGQSQMTIQFQGKDAIWSTSGEEIPSYDGYRILHNGSDKQIFIKKIPHHHIVKVVRPDGEFLFRLNKDDVNVQKAGAFLFGFLVIISLILFIAYRCVKRILAPLARLSTGVREVSAGNLDYRVGINGTDELSSLGNAFDTMLERIKTMLASREQLLIDVSHELRSPVTRLKLGVEMLADSEIKQTIKGDVVEMETMISDILDNARITDEKRKVDFKKTDIIPLLLTVKSQLDTTPPGIVLKALPNEINVNGDAEQIRIVLKNIIENSLKYAPNDTPLEISASESDGGWALFFHDEGPGVPKLERALVFEPFYRVDKSRSRQTGGYGLGLSICKKIMAMHNGGIQMVEPPENKGTLVKVWFPAEGAAAPSD